MPPQTESPLATRLASVRRQTMALAEPLSEADSQVQAMPDASPVKWHLAHTTWFFETFVLEPFEPGYQPFHPAFRVLFNSYYNGVGEQHPRPQRGLVTRPSLAEVLAYRRHVDAQVAALLARDASAELAARVELGLQHEQQHQELILTDLQYLLSCNPLSPAYLPPPTVADAPGATSEAPLDFLSCDGGLVEIGHAGAGFAFDNEGPRHACYLSPFGLARRLVTQGEWAAFVADGGYREPRWWLSAGWAWVNEQRITAPLYWRADGRRFGLYGEQPLDRQAPVLHISLFEADAFAHWWNAQHPSAPPVRLPTEAEWEHVAQAHEAPGLASGLFLESRAFDTRALDAGAAPGLQLFGQAWQWTASAYQAYPGFRAWDGAVGEYNGKFMINQYVLRGGSFATPRSHIRSTYRNFFPADTRWQFTGLRLAHDIR
jgi:ergothioneine biosynthesis protein EgtB